MQMVAQYQAVRNVLQQYRDTTWQSSCQPTSELAAFVCYPDLRLQESQETET